jgi:hypothetical protein
MVKVEDFKVAFVQSIGNFVSPLIQTQSVVDPECIKIQAHGCIKKPMRIGIVGSRSAP